MGESALPPGPIRSLNFYLYPYKPFPLTACVICTPNQHLEPFAASSVLVDSARLRQKQGQQCCRARRSPVICAAVLRGASSNGGACMTRAQLHGSGPTTLGGPERGSRDVRT